MCSPKSASLTELILLRSVSVVQYIPNDMIDNGVVSVVQATREYPYLPSVSGYDENFIPLVPCCAGLIFGSQKVGSPIYS